MHTSQRSRNEQELPGSTASNNQQGGQRTKKQEEQEPYVVDRQQSRELEIISTFFPGPVLRGGRHVNEVV